MKLIKHNLNDGLNGLGNWNIWIESSLSSWHKKLLGISYWRDKSRLDIHLGFLFFTIYFWIDVRRNRQAESP